MRPAGGTSQDASGSGPSAAPLYQARLFLYAGARGTALKICGISRPVRGSRIYPAYLFARRGTRGEVSPRRRRRSVAMAAASPPAQGEDLLARHPPLCPSRPISLPSSCRQSSPSSTIDLEAEQQRIHGDGRARRGLQAPALPAYAPGGRGVLPAAPPLRRDDAWRREAHPPHQRLCLRALSPTTRPCLRP